MANHFCFICIALINQQANGCNRNFQQTFARRVSVESLRTTCYKPQTFLGLRINFATMKFNVQVKVMPLKELLDPQGKAVMSGLGNLGFNNVDNVRIGKNISLDVEASSKEEAKQIAEEASKKLLSNPVMEYFEINVD